MKPLKITYYLENNFNTVKPFVHEDSNYGQEYFEMKQSLELLENLELSKKTKEEGIFVINAMHYSDLIKKGYTIEQISELLKQQLNEKQDNASRISTIVGLSKEIENLELASSNDTLMTNLKLFLVGILQEKPEQYDTINSTINHIYKKGK